MPLRTISLKMRGFVLGILFMAKLLTSGTNMYVYMVIGLLRQKYRVLQSTLPIGYLLCSDKKGNRCCPVVDRLIRVCYALINLCPSLSICVHLTECCFNNKNIIVYMYPFCPIHISLSYSAKHGLKLFFL